MDASEKTDCNRAYLNDRVAWLVPVAAYLGPGVAVSAYPPFSIPGGTLKLVSAYRTQCMVGPRRVCVRYFYAPEMTGIAYAVNMRAR